MMFTIQTLRSKRRAERRRDEFIKAQVIVDTVWARVTGETPIPPAESAYRVIADGRRWAVVMDDPSA